MLQRWHLASVRCTHRQHSTARARSICDTPFSFLPPTSSGKFQHGVVNSTPNVSPVTVSSLRRLQATRESRVCASSFAKASPLDWRDASVAPTLAWGAGVNGASRAALPFPVESFALRCHWMAGSIFPNGGKLARRPRQACVKLLFILRTEGKGATLKASDVKQLKLSIKKHHVAIVL